MSKDYRNDERYHRSSEEGHKPHRESEDYEGTTGSYGQRCILIEGDLIHEEC